MEAGLLLLLRLPLCWTNPSRSKAASCARTALSVRSSAWASSSTVRLARRNRVTILPRVLVKKRRFLCDMHLLQLCSLVYHRVASIVKKLKRLFDFLTVLCYRKREEYLRRADLLIVDGPA